MAEKIRTNTSKGSHFYLVMNWNETLANQISDIQLAPFFEHMYEK